MSFDKFHEFLHTLYFGHDCKHGHIHLTYKDNKKVDNSDAKAAFDAAMQRMHQTQSFSFTDKETKNLHRALNDSIASGMNYGITTEMPSAMQLKLKNDVFVFSGMKTYAELKEASGLLLDSNGKQKNFSDFKNDVQKINNTYNESYLQAEYNFAVASAQQASNWANIDDESDLRYRTVEDGRVREEHALLDKITLPKTNPFWDNYYPPNGWNCRCIAVEVNAGKYQNSNASYAEELGQQATTQLDKNGNNAAAIFRFNPGKQEVVFPPSHPYYAQHCNGAKLNVTGLIGKARMVLANEQEKCEWQNELKKQLPVQVNDPDFSKRYDDIEFKQVKGIQNGGELELPVNASQFPQEFEKNKKVLTALANKGLKFRVLPVIGDGSKEPDAFDKATNLYSDVKVAESQNFKNVVQNSFRKSKGQGNEIIIELLEMPTSKEAYTALKGALNPDRNKHVQHIIFVYKDEYKAYNATELRERLYNKKSDK